VQSTYKDSLDRPQLQKVLNLESETSSTTRTLILRQSWFDTHTTEGSFVHVIGDFDSKNTCIINNDVNMLILHPDHLVSATVVADSFGCIRRAVLQDRVKATSQASAPMLYGNLLHELFQHAITHNIWDPDTLATVLTSMLPRHFETMAQIGLNVTQLREYLFPRLQEMALWAERFVRKSPHQQAHIKSRNGETSTVCVNKLLDIEEHVWSPNYGLKGNIDATVQITIKQDSISRTLTVPLEVKTGKRVSEAHQAQTALYTLLVSDRYDLDVTDGILYYLENSEIMRVKAVRHELIHMIMKRNELACYIRERLELPPLLEPSKQRLCNNCYAKSTCRLYHKLSEEGDGSLIEKKEEYLSMVSSLKHIHQSFFQKWDSLITKEESEMMKFRRELWTMLSTEREKLNRCFAHVIIDTKSTLEQPDLEKINRYQYSFIKQAHEAGFSFTESQIIVGEPIVISDELGHFALANGYVTHIHKNRITVAVDRRLQNARIRKRGFNRTNYQSFTGIMELEPQSSMLRPESDTETAVYRIDKDEFSNGMALVRNNMLQIMDNSVFRASDLRALIIENRKPKFKIDSSGWTLQSQTWKNEMNSDQRMAIEKVLSAEDYALVLGMPGTGKTTTIAHIIRCLVAKGKTVLLTSYTHTAVDNILLKVKDAGFSVLRLGVRAKVHPQVQEFAILASDPKESLEDLDAAWHKPPVVATTCLGVNHPIFSQRTFDYCIVDEASQITLPVCLGPIRMAKSFILVGDHFQLPPLVQNKAALEGGLDVSLFRMLSEQHPEAVVSLEHQYRMSADIMAVANALIYSGRLKCGNEAVATRSLHLPHADAVLSAHHFGLNSAPSLQDACISPSSTCFLNRILDPNCSVLFLNTDALGTTARDISLGNRTTNPFESAITVNIATLLISAGLPSTDLGIVTFYRSQLALMRHSALKGYPSLELHTADKFQGRDKEAIIVSFVRSNEEGSVGDLLRDWRRINVAVTRARSKLILIGSESTLAQGGDTLQGLVEMCREKSWMIDLQSDIMDGHLWPSETSSWMDGEVGSSYAPSREGPGGKRKGNGTPMRTPSRRPEKVARLNRETLAGARPVLNDIMNDIL
jgi:DNA replication ATP-dependent helicase Dna2